VEWVPVCPEVELGMGIPRPTIRLEAAGDDVRLICPTSGEDYTERMRRFARERVEQLAPLALCGYVLKKSSPSCGMERVKVWRGDGVLRYDGRGLFAAELMRRFPALPVEEEGRLQDPRLRENFFERVFAYRRLRALLDHPWTRGELVAFHTAHKYQLLAHSPAHYRKLGRMVASVKEHPPDTFAATYTEQFMEALTRLATPGRNVNALQHMLGYLTERIDATARAELREVIDDYARGDVPLIVPLTLLRHHVSREEIEYLQQQIYLAPHPKSLRLRNDV